MAVKQKNSSLRGWTTFVVTISFIVDTVSGVSLDDTLSRLNKRGIDAKPGDKLKDLAGKLGVSPLEFLNMIQGKEQ